MALAANTGRTRRYDTLKNWSLNRKRTESTVEWHADTDQKQQAACRICGAASVVFPATNGDFSYYCECSCCGKFRFRVTAVVVIENGGAGKMRRIPKWLEDQREGGTDMPLAKARLIEVEGMHHPCIERLHVRGFRSLADVELCPVAGANVLIGANGSGKSNFVHFFNMLSWMLKSRRLAEFVSREGGADDQLHGGNDITPRLDAEITIRTDTGRNDYRFSLMYAHPDQLLFSDEAFRYSRDDFDTEAEWNHLGAGHREALIVRAGQGNHAGLAASRWTARTVTHLLRNCAAYQFHNTGSTSNFKKTWDAGDHAYMRTDGGNLAAILYRLEHEDLDRYELVCRHIRRVLPGFDCFQIEEQYGKVALRWRSHLLNKTYGAHLTSDGSLRFFALATLLNLPGEMLPGVLVLDEPELGLHPKSIALVGDMIGALAESRQIILATQSPLLVDAFELDEVFVLEMRDGRTELKSPDSVQLETWLDEFSVGEMWQKNLLGGRP